MEQNSNELALHPKQLQAVVLLASGKSVNETAQELGVHRTTVWEWKRQEPFQAYFNAYMKEQQQQIDERLFSLVDKSFESLEFVLQHGNENARFKAASYVIDTALRKKPGETDPRELIRQNCTKNEMDTLLKGEETVNEEKYRQRCKEVGLDNPDDPDNTNPDLPPHTR